MIITAFLPFSSDISIRFHLQRKSAQSECHALEHMERCHRRKPEEGHSLLVLVKQHIKPFFFVYKFKFTYRGRSWLSLIPASARAIGSELPRKVIFN